MARINLENNLMKQIKLDNLKLKAMNLKLAIGDMPKVSCNVMIPSMCWKTGMPKPSVKDWAAGLAAANAAFAFPKIPQLKLDKMNMLKKLMGKSC